MPYRRLPNTDAARIRAIQNAIHVTMSMHPSDIAFEYSLLQKAKFFLPTFKTGINHQRADYSQTVEKNSNLTQLHKKTKMYISHFIQVMHMAIQREELTLDILQYYGLEKFPKKMPPMQTDEEVIAWGKKLIEGENKRVQEGGTPMTNPRISMLKINYDKFIVEHRSQSFSQAKKENTTDYITELRNNADSLILQIWNEVEKKFEHLSPEDKRKKAQEYGVSYVFRKSELQKKDVEIPVVEEVSEEVL